MWIFFEKTMAELNKEKLNISFWKRLGKLSIPGIKAYIGEWQSISPKMGKS